MPVFNPNTAAGLIDFTESATLYNTKYYNRFSVSSAQANVNVVLSPKGTGGLSLQQADGTATGGDIRGDYSIDLQTSRGAAAQVASGYGAFTQGVNCTASATYAFASGSTCTASGLYGFARGDACTASGWYSLALGSSCSTTGNYGFAQGNLCNAFGFFSSASGAGAETSIWGAAVRSGFNFSARGDCQSLRMTLGGSTTGTTPVVLTAQSSSPSSVNQLICRANEVITFTALVNAKNTTNPTTGGASWLVKGRVSRTSLASSVVLNYSNIEILFNPDSCVLTVTADTTYGGVAFTFTGQAATPYRVSVSIDAAEAF